MSENIPSAVGQRYPKGQPKPNKGTMRSPMDDRVDHLIAEYEQEHRDDERIAQITRQVYTGGSREEFDGADVPDDRYDPIAPLLKKSDNRGVEVGVLRTPEDVAVYEKRFADTSSAELIQGSQEHPGDKVVVTPGEDSQRQAFAFDSSGKHWIVVVGPDSDNSLVAHRFVREHGFSHERSVPFDAHHLLLPIVVIEPKIREAEHS